jgi:hypothetical protein
MPDSGIQPIADPRTTLAWSHEIESTVGYLGIEVDDALAIAEEADV